LKVLVIGGGGREHALAWRLSQCDSVERVYAAPGNPGIAQVAECIPATINEQWISLAEEKGIDLTVVGPEAPLVGGIVDLFRAKNFAIVGPTSAAAQLEGSKAFSKAFMQRAGIPTAEFVTVESARDAHQLINQFGYPVVLKADGLAAGKGVIIAEDARQAKDAIEQLTAGGGRLVIEQFLTGEEVSFIVLTDGRDIVPFTPTQDHKRVGDGDRGPNTGGMGAYADASILSENEYAQIIEQIIRPTLDRMSEEGNPFTGFLYAGIILTSDGPKVLEFNARMGDPETQPIMQQLNGDLASALHGAAVGNLASVRLPSRAGASVCVVLAAQGYPGQVKTGDLITGIHDAEQTGAKVFQAGTKQTDKGLETAGGRVLGVTAADNDLAGAIKHAYSALSQIHFRGMHYRTDIGSKGLKRMAGW
jgi:phosphoribosylamine--glycine ligase